MNPNFLPTQNPNASVHLVVLVLDLKSFPATASPFAPGLTPKFALAGFSDEPSMSLTIHFRRSRWIPKQPQGSSRYPLHHRSVCFTNPWTNHRVHFANPWTAPSPEEGMALAPLEECGSARWRWLLEGGGATCHHHTLRIGRSMALGAQPGFIYRGADQTSADKSSELPLPDIDACIKKVWPWTFFLERLILFNLFILNKCYMSN